MNVNITVQRIQYIKDCTKVSEVLNLEAAYERLYETIPKDLQHAIKEKLQEFKIEDENEILDK